MRRHPVTKGAHIIIVLGRVEAALLHLFAQQRIVMDALAAGGNLEAAPQQVEAPRGLRIIIAEGGIHRALGEREADNIEKIRAVFFLGPGAEQSLSLRVKVASLAAAMALSLEELSGLLEGHLGYFHPPPAPWRRGARAGPGSAP